METLISWGLGILASLVTAGVTAYAKHKIKKFKTERDQAIADAKKIEQDKLDHLIDVKIEPVYQELEDLRAYIRKNSELEKHDLELILASYRFRLIQLCRGFLHQGYMTPDQMESLTEFYKVYSGLGGNGQAKVYYERVMQLPIRDNEDD